MQNLVGNTLTTQVQQLATLTDAEKSINRINAISRVGVYLLKGGASETRLWNYLESYACGRYPGTYQYDEEVLKNEVHIAVQQANRDWFEPSKKSFAELVYEWVATKKRQFTLQDGYNELRLQQVGEKKHFRTVLSRLVEKGEIKKEGSRSGVYKPIDKDTGEQDWKSASETKAPLWLPFDLGEISVIPYGSIILIAGAPNSGKTAALMNTAMENMNQFDTHYFSSEIGPGAFKNRASKFLNIMVEDWKVSFYQKTGDFEDFIKPGKGKLNIIDYLEVHTDFYKVGDTLKKIHENLKEAICVLALQKNPGADTGRGGTFTLEKPQIAISLDSGTAKCVKLKEWDDKF